MGGRFKVGHGARPRGRVLTVAVAMAAVLVAGSCSSKEPPKPAILTTTTALGVASVTCPNDVEVVLTTGPIAIGTPVADAAAAGSLVRTFIPARYAPDTVIEPANIGGTFDVPVPANSVVLHGALESVGQPPVPITPAASCWTGPDEPASVLVARDPVYAGTTLGDAIGIGSVVLAEIPLSLIPDGIIVADGLGIGTPRVDPGAARLAAVTDVPANTIITSTVFA